jgi:DNA-binding response OmpR family regulator
MNESPAKILYVEDDTTLSYITKENLERLGYSIDCYRDGLSAWNAYSKHQYQLCLLDVMLPIMDGFSLAKKIRETNKEIPIIFLTAKSLQEDKIEGLLLGADDYIIKPYSVEELRLRINIFLKRNRITNEKHLSENIFELPEAVFNFDSLELQTGGQVHRLTYREAELLKFFCIHRNELLAREIILKELWKENNYFLGRSLDVFISRLRKNFKNNKSIKIKNVHGIGFIFSVQE